MRRRFRLTRSADIERVRQTGRSFPHPLLVLIARPSENVQAHVAIVAGRSVGGAVERSRAKRLLRAGLEGLLPRLSTGWDFLFLARRPLVKAGFWKTQTALELVLKRANLLVADPARNERSE